MPQPRKRLILRGSCSPIMTGSPTQQQTSLTSPAGMVYTFSFSFVLVCLVIFDPVQQGDDQLSCPFCLVSAVPVTVWCSGWAILCVVMYRIVRWFAFNYNRILQRHPTHLQVISHQNAKGTIKEQ